jgi:hypothetical protein
VLPPFGRQASRQDPEEDHAHSSDYGACAGVARRNARVRLARVNRLGGLVNKLMKARFQVLYRRMRGGSNLAREGMSRHIREIGQGGRKCPKIGTAAINGSGADQRERVCAQEEKCGQELHAGRYFRGRQVSRVCLLGRQTIGDGA